MFRLKTLLPLLILVATISPLLGPFASSAYAHGFGERYDLPLPLTYFAIAGASAVVLSFVVVGVFLRGEHNGVEYPRLNLFRLDPVAAILTGPVSWALKLASLLLFFLVIATGLFGSERPG